MTSDLPDTVVAESAMSEAAIDHALAESFPASDPPCWTLGPGDTMDTSHLAEPEPSEPSDGGARRNPAG